MRRFDLKDATAIVTGGSRGIGPHIAGALAQRGAQIALVARSGQGLEAAARALTASGVRVITITADITSAGDRHTIVQTTERELGPVDVLVNNAGGDLQREFHNLTETDIEGVLELNLTGAVILSRLVLPGMLARGRGHIVNVSSMAGRTSFPLTEAYAAAKDGLIGFTRVLRGDYRRRGVSGSALILGPVRGAGAGVSTAEEVGIKAPGGPLTVSPARVAQATVRAIVKDKAELAVMPGPSRMLRALMDRFPAIGPALNHAAGIDKTMLTIAEFRERQARPAAAGHHPGKA